MRNAEAGEPAQKHFRWTIEGPDSSYCSRLEIHICWKVENDARVEPPIHTEYLRSGVANTHSPGSQQRHQRGERPIVELTWKQRQVAL